MRLWSGLVILVLLVVVLPARPDGPALRAQEAHPDDVRAAAGRALAAIQKAQAPWYTTNKQVCASCHHQYQPAIAYRTARDHRIPFDESIAKADAFKAVSYTHLTLP